MDTYFDAGIRTTLSRPGELCLAARSEHLGVLRSSKVIGSLGPAAYAAVEPGEDIAEQELANARVLVIEVDPENADSLRRVRTIRADHPDLKIIAAIARANVSLVKTLVRQGICDVTELPFQPDELAAQILDAASEPLELADEVPLAPLYMVVRSQGGSGSTSVLTHLAAALAQHLPAGQKVCIADLDLQGGDVAAFVSTPAPVTVGALFEAGDRLDDALVSSAVLETRYGFSLVAAPESIMPLDLVSAEQVNAVIGALRRRFAMVLIDLPADWTNWSLSLALNANGIFMVTDSSIAGLRQGRRRVDLLESIGVERGKIKLIANRIEKRLFRTVGTDDIGDALRAEVAVSLGDEAGALRAAQDQGVLLGDMAGKTAWVKAIDDLARRLLAGEI